MTDNISTINTSVDLQKDERERGWQSDYARLRVLDETLPETLTPQGAQLAFSQAFKKIQDRQQEEITYLTEHHPEVIVKPKYTRVIQDIPSKSIKSLEVINAFLDKINSEVITGQIDINSNELNLNELNITRLPVTLFQTEPFVKFWKNLICLHCNSNLLLTALDVRELVELEMLYCFNNKLITLKVEGLARLKELDCEENEFTILDLRGLISLQYLSFDNDGLIDLNLRGVHPDTEKKYEELTRSLLFKQLSQSDSTAKRQGVIARLGADYTYENCCRYCPGYAVKLFASDFANSTVNGLTSIFSQLSTFLPSFNTAMPPENEQNRPADNVPKAQRPKRD